MKRIMAAGLILGMMFIGSGCGLQDGTFVFNLNGEAKIEKETAASEKYTSVQTEQLQQAEQLQQTEYSRQDEVTTGRKPLFKDADGTIHGSQLNLGEGGTPVYDYDIEVSLAEAPQEWVNYTYPGRKQSYLSPSGTWLFKDADGTIHGAQIGTTDMGSILFDYEFDVNEIPEEWRN